MWWGQKEDEFKVHWKSWDFLGLPKSEGGLGFRNLVDFNTALLAKQVWRLHTNPEAFWAKVLKGIYYPNCDILNADKSSRASWAWSSLLEGKALIVGGSSWQVGNGLSIDLSKDNWLINSSCGYLRPIAPLQSHVPSKVADIIDWDGPKWNIDPINDLISDVDQLTILRTSLCDQAIVLVLNVFGLCLL